MRYTNISNLFLD